MQEKLAAAVKAAEQFNAGAVETDERKRRYNAADSVTGDAEPTPGADGLALRQRHVPVPVSCCMHTV